MTGDFEIRHYGSWSDIGHLFQLQNFENLDLDR